MASKSCMNVMCGGASSTSISTEWKKGWTLRSGEFANLCDNCGSAYEQSIFCEVFHSKESGWRDCTSCGKRLHCGCIAARVLLELLDSGGVNCISCAKSLRPHAIMSDEKPNGIGMTTVDNVGELQTNAVHNQTDDTSINNLELIQCMSDSMGFKHLLHSQNGEANGSVGQMKQEEFTTPSRETGTKSVSDSNKPSIGSSQTTKPEDFRRSLGVNYTYESLAQTNLSITLGAPSGNLNPFPSAAVDERETSSSVQGPRSRQLLPKPPKSALAAGLEIDAEIIQHLRVARPPAEGRGRNQLLPRYWPRITDQELQQISGDSNCVIVPLFEKILSASDAGRIGRLVLPKACAEAYFPPISHPEGLPLRIQDVKGKEWVFQFRFWPNNNSRMYVLEGVTPCIQSMQLQAGDTVTFSRMDPEGKLFMGFRKASNSVSMQSLKGSTDSHIDALSKHLISACEDSRWHNPEKHGGATIESLMLQSMLVPERKSTRNIGSKSKRLLIDSQDALELKLTWEEVQDMLQPPPSVRASLVTVEDHEFEEYEEPPVFGKRSIFVIRTSGGQEQWAQCDNCSKWRRLPVDVLLPSRWTCTENSWDLNRCSCSAREELSLREVENLLRHNKDFKKRKMATSHGPILEHESSGLDALATVHGDNSGTSVATTTKHPRHRPGCSCIVCIQPPSGKGKHNPTCTCNVCMTVKRRFKTLMMRKKKRQSEREAEIAQRNHFLCNPKDEDEVYSTSRHVTLQLDLSDNDSRLLNIASESNNKIDFSSNKLAETSKGHIDLNSHPGRGEDLQVGSARVSMMSLLQIASHPLETYLNQNGLTSLISEKQTSSGSHMLSQAIRDSKERLNEDRCLASEPAVPVHEQDGRNDEHH